MPMSTVLPWLPIHMNSLGIGVGRGGAGCHATHCDEMLQVLSTLTTTHYDAIIITCTLPQWEPGGL